MADQVQVSYRPDGVAVVQLDDTTAKLNTLSRQAIDELLAVFLRLQGEEGVRAVVLTGKPGGGLGAGANIGELLNAGEEGLRHIIHEGHKLLNLIEDFPRPVVAHIGNLALGGILELAMPAKARVADPKGQLGFPEINLLLFPGLFGAIRAARRGGLEKAIGLVLEGKPIGADVALAAGLIDEISADGIEAAARLALELAAGAKSARPDLSFSEEELAKAVAAGRVAVGKSNRGRPRPRAGHVFLDYLPRGLGLPRDAAQAAEAEAFFGLTLGPEGKAGMRFFFVNTAAAKPPKALQKVQPKPIKSIGVAGADGYMGNAIAWLALANAKASVVAWTSPDSPPGIPSTQARLEGMRQGLLAKYGALVKKGAMSEAQAQEAVGRVRFTSELADLASCDFIIEAIVENPEVKQAFFEALAGRIRPEAIVASNSSSMGPGFLAEGFLKGGGNPKNFVNLHFFSPAELPALALTEIIAGEETSPETLATTFAVARSMKKTPVLLKDGSRGFLVNAVLSAYMLAAEQLLREGTSVEALDAALTAAGMPQGYATLLDAVGLDTCAGMLRFMGEQKSVLFDLVAAGRMGRKNGKGFFEYDAPGIRSKVTGVFAGLDAMMPGRGNRAASPEEIEERCYRAMYEKARELLGRGIMDSRESADLALILGIGFPVYLGGIFFYAQQKGWEPLA